ncbi:hypothetical protein G6O69_01465 [Pseudenhygromyxa sp. WMMC2535]|uniref:hypothetical protein n=1 Tax=Pseudenhygromyxa sp. WMMC2535 TaxID=2712867 RepID=UPI0015549DD8|nr:hypothetical protein [Pseudenhygromyxa sp. WMMC2535]NVB36481.1 hypothetical protein [Pseudenhygromyxa sp. WMMC2535]
MEAQDPLAEIAAELEATPVQAIELRRFRRTTKGLGERAAVWLADELLGGEDVGDSGEGDDPPGMELSALIGAERRRLREFHPLVPEQMWAAQASVMRVAQRRGVALSVRADALLGVAGEEIERYLPVADRMRRALSASEQADHQDSRAILEAAGWRFDADGRGCSLAIRKRPRPLLALLLAALLAIWVIAMPFLLLALLFRAGRAFIVGVLQSVWAMATKARTWEGSLRLDSELLHLRETQAGESEEQRVRLDEIFALGLSRSGWSAPGAAHGVRLWTARGCLDFGPPRADNDKERASGPASQAAIVALEAWLWARLAEAWMARAAAGTSTSSTSSTSARRENA